jgi:hypothetical protein
MAIVRLFAGSDDASHFEDVEPAFEPRGDQSYLAELVPGSGILVRRFELGRENRGITPPAATRCSPCAAPSTSRSATARCDASDQATSCLPRTSKARATRRAK